MVFTALKSTNTRPERTVYPKIAIKITPNWLQWQPSTGIRVLRCESRRSVPRHGTAKVRPHWACAAGAAVGRPMDRMGGADGIICTRYGSKALWARLAIVMLIFYLLLFCTGVFELCARFFLFFSFRFYFFSPLYFILFYFYFYAPVDKSRRTEQNSLLFVRVYNNQ